ncbi:Metal-dependent protein hydrolase [Trichostrongylus colubriformis]|uniref:Metal-dependent protein hydrolase n=1 Tax=Trichostrongylus colubriformis TaxID=6319 RepID=A0AAN8FY02_TRICO
MVGVIGTHNGKFHCDEVFACYMLKRLHQFSDYTIIRTRDPSTLETCDIVVDVGGVYDHSTKRYDHHQKEFTETMQTLGVLDFNTKLSSAGLIYVHYGKQLIAELLGTSYEDRMVNIFYRKLYETFVEAVDAVDNGIPQYDGIPRYQTSGGLSGRVGHLNPHWNEVDVNPDERFQQAMELVGGEFESSVSYLANVWWPAREIVEKAIDDCSQASRIKFFSPTLFCVDSSGRIVYLPCGGVPWKEHFFEIEEQKGLVSRRMTYIIFEDTTAKNYRIQAIPNSRLSTFDNRMSLPKAWRGLRDAELSEVSGIPGCIFVHTTGFIGGNQTLEGALTMARKALVIGDAERADEISSEEELKKAKLDSPMDQNSESVQT